MRQKVRLPLRPHYTTMGTLKLERESPVTSAGIGSRIRLPEPWPQGPDSSHSDCERALQFGEKFRLPARFERRSFQPRRKSRALSHGFSRGRSRPITCTTANVASSVWCS